MGVDISHIIRHDFRDVNNRDDALEYTKEAIERLKKNLHLYGADEVFEITDDCGCLTFNVPVYDVELSLHNGFWKMESFCHYCQIVMHHGDYFWLRCITFDIARALGQNEAWYAEEYYTWNGGNIEEADVPIEDWLAFAEKKYGKPIPEFDQQAIMAQGDVHIPKYEPLYHDSFKECFAKFDKVQSEIRDFKLLGLHYTGNGYYRCEKNGGLYLINSRTFKPMFDKPIEAMLQSLNGSEFIIRKNGLSAVFDMDGNQLTDFVKGEFDWKWAKIDMLKEYHPKRIIFNEEANIELPPR